MDAVILAGGKTPEALVAALGASTSSERALIEIAGRACIAYILDSICEVEAIQNIIVVGGPSTLQAVESITPQAAGIVAKETLAENLLAGANAATSSQVLICTCDIPLVSGATWREFLSRVEEKNLEAAYAIARRETIEEQFPGGRRTYASLKDGTFTGGNAFVLPRDKLQELKTVIEAAYHARKNPLAIARILGISFLFKALTKKLSVLDIEEKMSQVLKCRAGAIEMQDASLTFDVDKPEDFALAQSTLVQSTLSARNAIRKKTP